MKQHWRNVRPYVLGPLILRLARLLGSTWKIRTVGYEDVEALPGGKIFSGWHGTTFTAAVLFRGKGVWTIISQSKDGDMQNIIFSGFGFRTIRGSTGRGGARAAAESIRVLKQGATMAFTPDGPRGPTHVVQPGIIVMAKKAGVPIVPVGVSAERRWLAPTWDRYMVPKPFARCVMVFGEPHRIPRDADEAALEEARLAFEKAMLEVEAEAERLAGHETATPS
ncbi:MAG: lysophospholipid acyltransferase family protein [Fimbriimonadaceae bacterium]|nr:lysophospholipid acyltransferase family protein [Fimbriimonadaceae bacterium]QYK56193.1 MAG: lysophospholipid acyltransferase family protein [Fimbriimonadaceae bacterium]